MAKLIKNKGLLKMTEMEKPKVVKLYWVYSGWNLNGQLVAGHLHAIPGVICVDSAKHFVTHSLNLTRVEVFCRTTGELNEVKS